VARTLPWLRRDDGGFLAHMRAGDFTAEGKSFLTAYHSRLGTIRVTFDPKSRKPIELRYREPIEFAVSVRGRQGLEGGLSARIQRVDGSKDESKAVQADGSARFKKLQPGRYKVSLTYNPPEGRGQWQILATEVDVTERDWHLTLRVPRLYTLRVHAPDFPAGSDVFMSTGRGGPGFVHMTKLPEGGVLEVEHVPPGKYYVAVGKVRKTFEVSGDTDVTVDVK